MGSSNRPLVWRLWLGGCKVYRVPRCCQSLMILVYLSGLYRLCGHKSSCAVAKSFALYDPARHPLLSFCITLAVLCLLTLVGFDTCHCRSPLSFGRPRWSCHSRSGNITWSAFFNWFFACFSSLVGIVVQSFTCCSTVFGLVKSFFHTISMLCTTSNVLLFLVLVLNICALP